MTIAMRAICIRLFVDAKIDRQKDAALPNKKKSDVEVKSPVVLRADEGVIIKLSIHESHMVIKER